MIEFLPVIIENGWYVFSRERVGCVTNKKTSFSNSAIANNNTLHILTHISYIHAGCSYTLAPPSRDKSGKYERKRAVHLTHFLEENICENTHLS